MCREIAGNNRIAGTGQYLTKMPPKEVLEKKLLQAIANAKEQLDLREQ